MLISHYFSADKYSCPISVQYSAYKQLTGPSQYR
jgi:hypothetical protein